MHKLNILVSFGPFVVSWSQVTVYYGKPTGLNLHEEYHSPLMPRISLKSSLDIQPLKLLYFVRHFFGTKNQRSNSYQIMIRIQTKLFTTMFVNLRVIQTLQNHLSPASQNTIIIPQQHIVTVQLNNFLQTKNNKIHFIIQKSKHFLALFFCQSEWVYHTTVPGHHIKFHLLKSAIFCLV